MIGFLLPKHIGIAQSDGEQSPERTDIMNSGDSVVYRESEFVKHEIQKIDVDLYHLKAIRKDTNELCQDFMVSTMDLIKIMHIIKTQLSRTMG